MPLGRQRRPQVQAGLLVAWVVVTAVCLTSTRFSGALHHGRSNFGQGVASRVMTPDAWWPPSEGRKSEVHHEFPGQA